MSPAREILNEHVPHFAAIVGGVVGGVLGVAALGALLIYLKRKHDNTAWTAADGLSVYSGRSEKVGSTHMSQMGRSVAPSAMGGLAPPPPGTYYATDDTGNLHLVMGYASQESDSLPPVPASVGAESTLASPIGRPTAPPGTLPEPVSCSNRCGGSCALMYSPFRRSQMDDRDEAQSVPSPVMPGGSPFSDRAASSARFDQAGTNARDPHRGHTAFQPISEREGVLGAQGLDDPSSFSSQRLPHHEV